MLYHKTEIVIFPYIAHFRYCWILKLVAKVNMRQKKLWLQHVEVWENPLDIAVAES